MPVLDMPLEELQKYRGTNPCPEDFDRFWEDALSEMHELDAETELKRAEFQVDNAECYDLFFTGVGGARIHAQLCVPKRTVKPAPAVLQFHGYTGDAGNWCGKLGYVNEGFVVAALDCRGQAGLSEDRSQVRGNTLNGHVIRGLEDAPEKLLYRAVFLDTAQLADIVMGLEYVDETRVAAMGPSQGGGLTLACAALVPNLNRAAAVYPFLTDYKRVWEMDLMDGYREVREFFRHTDPCHQNEDLYFNRLGYIDVHHLAHRVRSKVLMITGLQDQICPPSTQFAVYNHLNCDKEMVLYPDFGHEELPWVWDRIFQYICEMKHES